MFRFVFPISALRKTLALASVSIFISASCLTPQSFALVDVSPQIHFTTLASGQQIYVEENHTQPIVTIDTWVNTGSAEEDAANNGVSHFLEHLLFKGTKTHQVGEIDKILESRGADFNAATSDDFTHFHITTASPYFKEALDLHADMLLNATINTPELDRERKVVQEEINRALDNPQRKAYIALSQMMYGKHPYAMDTLGPKSNIQNLPREDIMGYYHKWYQPENFKTIVVGDVKTEEVVDLVNQAFTKAYAEQKRPEPGEAKLYPVTPVTAPKAAVLSDPNLSETHLEIGFVAPSITQREENYALDIAAMVLGQGDSSRLYRHVKEVHQLVTDISASNSTAQQSGTFYIGGDLKPENREEAKKAIIDVVNHFKEQGPTAAEMEKAKTQVIKQFAFANESTVGVAESIGYNVTIGNLEDYTQYANNIQKVTPEQVTAAARKYLNFNNAIMVEMIPGKTEAANAQQASQNIAMLKAAERNTVASKTPTQKPVDKMTYAVTKTVLPNGATLLLKQSPTTQTVSMAIFAKGGRLAESKPGLAALTARMMFRGTKNRNAEEIHQQIEELGLSLGADSDEDYQQITGASVAEDFPKLLMMLQDILVNPTFPQKELDTERDDLLQDLKTSRDQPSNLMFEKTTQALYPNHPYGEVGERIESALPGITREDIQAFYRQEMQPENMVISVVGNFDPEQANSSIQQILSDLPAADKSVAQDKFPNVPPLSDNVEVDAQKPEQADAWVAYGWLVPGISTSKDYITLKLINTLLGSGLSSRLFVDLREKQGLAYHVSSMYPSTLKDGRFVMYIGTDPKNVEKVQTGFNEEVARLLKEPVTPEELANVKSRLIGEFALSHESNASQAFYLGLYETLGVGYLFDTQYPSLIKQINADDIRRTSQNYFSRPKVMTIVAPKTVRNETSLNAD